MAAREAFAVRFGHRSGFLVEAETDATDHGPGESGMAGRELAMEGTLDHVCPVLT